MEPIPLLRNLLRQASVLYDDVARNYVARFIKQRFRLNRKVINRWRATKLLKEGRRGLSVLIRANAGEPKALQTVLKMSYGQTGRRKHELLEIQKPVVNQAPEEEPKPLVPGDPNTIPPALSPGLRALIIAQRQSGDLTMSMKAKIPAINSWGRPLSKRREINMLYEHHSELLRRVLPPLEAGGLERLELLTRGLEDPKPPKRKVLPDLPLPEGAKPHNITPRFKRRMWKKLLVKSTKLEFHEERGKWEATYSPYVKPQTSVGELADFEGMMDTRPPPRPKKNRKGRSEMMQELGEETPSI